ncbi:hypothetical protein MAPG_05187 [Magnaporthiopsis poae ATCC 64411]|uniref:Uncharacterized protein n=1 Tax=Magnaporthiopsis poae (strain ATCC 64411 / 73-15) TaxID=644358 RepID=A0A0C4DYR1_MAGP6|nr:hypothetical protein MAPG_05187 [Magnaporthiopsis poae ATCC 64411]
MAHPMDPLQCPTQSARRKALPGFDAPPIIATQALFSAPPLFSLALPTYPGTHHPRYKHLVGMRWVKTRVAESCHQKPPLIYAAHIRQSSPTSDPWRRGETQARRKPWAALCDFPCVVVSRYIAFTFFFMCLSRLSISTCTPCPANTISAQTRAGRRFLEPKDGEPWGRAAPLPSSSARSRLNCHPRHPRCCLNVCSSILDEAGEEEGVSLATAKCCFTGSSIRRRQRRLPLLCYPKSLSYFHLLLVIFAPSLHPFVTTSTNRLATQTISIHVTSSAAPITSLNAAKPSSFGE